jgi:hypothetical protein
MSTKNNAQSHKKQRGHAPTASLSKAAAKASIQPDHAATATDEEPETGYDLRYLVFAMLRPLYLELPLKAEAVLAAVTDAVRQAEKDGGTVRVTTGTIDRYYRTLMKRRLLRNATFRTR